MRWQQAALAIVAILVPIVAGLQGWTLAYVVSIERRLTRLETIDELRRRPAIATSSAARAGEDERASLPERRSVAGVEISAPIEDVVKRLMLKEGSN